MRRALTLTLTLLAMSAPACGGAPEEAFELPPLAVGDLAESATEFCSTVDAAADGLRLSDTSVAAARDALWQNLDADPEEATWEQLRSYESILTRRVEAYETLVDELADGRAWTIRLARLDTARARQVIHQVVESHDRAETPPDEEDDDGEAEPHDVPIYALDVVVAIDQAESSHLAATQALDTFC